MFYTWWKASTGFVGLDPDSHVAHGCSVPTMLRGTEGATGAAIEGQHPPAGSAILLKLMEPVIQHSNTFHWALMPLTGSPYRKEHTHTHALGMPGSPHTGPQAPRRARGPGPQLPARRLRVTTTATAARAGAALSHRPAGPPTMHPHPVPLDHLHSRHEGRLSTRNKRALT